VRAPARSVCSASTSVVCDLFCLRWFYLPSTLGEVPKISYLRPQRARVAQNKEDRNLSQTPTGSQGKAATSGITFAGSSSEADTPLLDLILTSLDDDKAEDVIAIGLKGKSEMADHMVIASGRSSRQVSAIAEHLVDKLKTDMDRLCRVEGKETGDWVLIDCGDAVVHIFRPEVREFYQLEKMWAPDITRDAAHTS
jgi:ribosome-associated protein